MNEILTSLIGQLREARPLRIVALTGAGISAESGVPTFRGADGLWENHRSEDLATASAFERDPHLVWRWYEWRRELIRAAEPNAAHLALARLEKMALGQGRIDVITQNVDGLHPLAGTTRLLELHGNIFRTRCTKEGTTRESRETFAGIPPRCECGALLRPDVVWFGEALDPAVWERSVSLVAKADLILIIGTSGVVYPAAGLMHLQKRGTSVEINPAATPLSSSCDVTLSMPAAEATPLICEAIEWGWR